MVAEAVDASKGYLEYHFPIISQKITRRYKAWRQEQQEKKRLSAKAAALKLFTDSKLDGVLVSRKQALRILRDQTDLPKNVLRNEINNVHQRML